jgi:RHS repeat-associated protein
MNYTNYTVATNFGVSGISEYKSSAAVPLVTSIVLPDGSQYSFTYEPTAGSCTPYSGTTCVTARIASVTLPTSGKITYSYSGGNNGIFSDGSAATLTRTTPDGTWTYARSIGSGAASTTTITAPKLPYDAAANQTVISFQGIYETQRQVFQGSSSSGTLLRQWSTCYNGNASNCNSTAITLPITQRTVIDQYGASGLQCKHNYFYDSFGNLKEQDDYDYGPGAPGPLLKKSLVSYASLGNITAFRQTVTICNGTGSSSSCAGPSGGNTGTVVAQTNYNYDEPNTLTTTSGIAQHTSVSGSRGNLTSINYPVASLTSHFTYYDTGSPNTSQDVNGATTTFNYSSNTASCQMAFPTSVSEPLNMSKSLTWNCTGGIATQATDENGQTVSTSYTDADFWRPASATDQTSATTSFTYAGQTAFESILNFNSGNSTADRLATFDSLGRPHVQQTRQSPGATTFDSVESDYDVVGRPNRTTLPYSASAGQTTSPTAPSVVTTYDALSRPLTVTDGGGGTTTYSYSNNGVPNNDILITLGPAPINENVKKRQLEYDSLGRLTSVCEITGASGSGTCAQGSQQTGYWTKYTYDALGDLLTVTQNAQAAAASQQTRSFTYDAMGRLLAEKNPETSQAAATYTYDSDSSCTPVSHGDLVKRVDPVGNTTCYQYDALHRPTSVTYSGPYASNTPNKYFVYDSATVNSIVMSNAKTRLAEAYTATSSTGTKITDVGLSYSKRGELTDVYESTPHSSGYNHTNAQFWSNGALNVLAGPGIPTMTYAPDGEGRIKTISASSGQNPVTATTYNTASLPTAVTLGSNDSDAFQYDSNTLRQTQYKFNVGSQSVTGNLGWNANSSLGSLDITDPFSASNTQNCSFSADDLSRVATANCGAIWGQSFSYDAFGNVSKQVLSGSAGTSFQPTYATTPSITNQIATLPGNVHPTYDANGNSLNDSFRTYTWDADNHAVSVVSGSSTVSLTYDAFDRTVEQARGTSYTQVVYSPLGSKLAKMNGATLQTGYVPLTSGASAIYNSSGLAYYRHADHLGSSRFASTPAQTMYSDTAYSAFGEPYAESGTADVSFTGQDQDTTSGVYDFLYRKYDPAQSRWTSPDPAGLAAVDFTDPQSWNRYAYVLNEPVAWVDPLGLTVCDANGNNCYDSVTVTASGDGRPWWGGGPGGPHALKPQSPANSEGGGGGFFSGLKDKFLDFLARNANYLPGVCTAGAFGFGTGGGGNASGGAEGGLLVDKQIGKATTAQPIGEVSYGPVGVGATPSEALVFVQPAPKVPVGAVFAADWHNGFINNSGISIGLFAGKFGHGKGLAGGFGGGAYLTFSSAANCLKNF